MEPFTSEEIQFIERAASFFEDPNFFVKGLNAVSMEIGKAQKRLPGSVVSVVSRAVKISLEKAVSVSVATVPSRSGRLEFGEATKKSRLSGWVHTAGAGILGGVSGFFGLPALPIELPVTTLVILRSIADTAQKYGFDVNSPEVGLECVYVFSMGSESRKDDEAMSTYYGSRLTFTELMKGAMNIVGTHSSKEILSAIESGTAQGLVRFIAKVAAIFEVRVTKKMIAQAVPMIGAAGGAAINAFFADYFKTAAQYHFGLRRLENERGYEQTMRVFEEARRRGARSQSSVSSYRVSD